MMQSDCDACLKLILPRSLEEPVVDFLLQHPAQAGAFIAYGVDGHGAPESILSTSEEVRGRAERIKVEILTQEVQARQLVAELNLLLPGAPISYWITTIVEAGRFT